MRKLLLILLLCSPAFAQKVVLTWGAVTPPATCTITAYNVYWSPTPGGEVMGVHPLTMNPNNATTFTDTTVTYGMTRYYKVTAWAGAPCNKESVFSNEVIAVIPAQVIIVQPPTLQPAQVIIP